VARKRVVDRRSARACDHEADAGVVKLNPETHHLFGVTVKEVVDRGKAEAQDSTGEVKHQWPPRSVIYQQSLFRHDWLQFKPVEVVTVYFIFNIVLPDLDSLLHQVYNLFHFFHLRFYIVEIGVPLSCRIEIEETGVEGVDDLVLDPLWDAFDGSHHLLKAVLAVDEPRHVQRCFVVFAELLSDLLQLVHCVLDVVLHHFEFHCVVKFLFFKVEAYFVLSFLKLG